MGARGRAASRAASLQSSLLALPSPLAAQAWRRAFRSRRRLCASAAPLRPLVSSGAYRHPCTRLGINFGRHSRSARKAEQTAALFVSAVLVLTDSCCTFCPWTRRVRLSALRVRASTASDGVVPQATAGGASRSLSSVGCCCPPLCAEPPWALRLALAPPLTARRPRRSCRHDAQDQDRNQRCARCSQAPRAF